MPTDRSFIVKIRVYYEDTDAGGVVYHANYLKFCERARSELFFERGLSPAIDGGHFVVSQIEASFHSPAKLGDTLIVKNSIIGCLLYTSPSPRDRTRSRMPSSA